MPPEPHTHDGPCAALQVALARIESLERDQGRTTKQLDDIQTQLRGVNDRIAALATATEHGMGAVAADVGKAFAALYSKALWVLIPIGAALLFLTLTQIAGGKTP